MKKRMLTNHFRLCGWLVLIRGLWALFMDIIIGFIGSEMVDLYWRFGTQQLIENHSPEYLYGVLEKAWPT
jgi:hypothetical protein